jgi:PadR family transcriptional regulator, regulatory protein AphA
MVELSPTGRVILGMLSIGRNTGYEIKHFVDKTTRHFWAASYGQIYPELRRLEDQGLITSRPEPSGGRARTVFELTQDGHAGLREWLEDPSASLWELRSEAMLKLFFSDADEPRFQIEQLRAFREQQEAKLAALHALEEGARTSIYRGPYLSLRVGLSVTGAVVQACRELEQELTDALNDDGSE